MKFMYVVAHPEGYRKIGISNFPARRIEEHEKDCGSPLVGEAIFKCDRARDAEASVISELAPFRMRGREWFSVDYETAARAISAATGTNALPFDDSSAPDAHCERINFIASEAWLEGIDGWRRKQRPIPSRSEAIRVLVDWALERDAGS